MAWLRKGKKNKEEVTMAEFYDIYPKDRWKEPEYKVIDKFSLKGKKGFVRRWRRHRP